MKQRYVYFDVMRIIAIFLVLFNHQPAYKLYFRESGIMEVVALFEAVFTRINVPLFAMISGALLLGRTESLRQLWNKRISRILIVLALFSPLLYLELGWLRDKPINFHDFIYGFFANNIKGQTSYWFLYAYLGMLLMLPYLRKVAQSMTRSEFIWLMVLHVIFSTLVPLCNFILQLCHFDALILTSSFSVPLSSLPLVFYPLIGYYINEHIDVDKITLPIWSLLLLVALACSSITAFVVYMEGITLKFSEHYIGLFTFVNVIVVFLAVKRLFVASFTMNHPRLSKAITLIGSLTFGVYLLDLAVQLPIYEQLKAAIMSDLGAIGFTILWCVISFVIGGTLTFLLKQLPLFKKIL